jgi:hypothetical protein
VENVVQAMDPLLSLLYLLFSPALQRCPPPRALPLRAALPRPSAPFPFSKVRYVPLLVLHKISLEQIFCGYHYVVISSIAVSTTWSSN